MPSTRERGLDHDEQPDSPSPEHGSAGGSQSPSQEREPAPEVPSLAALAQAYADKSISIDDYVSSLFTVVSAPDVTESERGTPAGAPAAPGVPPRLRPS